MIPSIPKQEYFDRIAKFQANMKAAGLDACLVHGTESDFANVRYLTEYWPTFEQAGVFVPAEGKAVLLIGPESEKYARGRSVVPDVMLMLNYRESAEPDYPGIPLSTYDQVAKVAMGNKPLKKLGLVGTAVMTKPTLDAVAAQLPGVEVVAADAVCDVLHRRPVSEDHLFPAVSAVGRCGSGPAADASAEGCNGPSDRYGPPQALRWKPIR